MLSGEKTKPITRPFFENVKEFLDGYDLISRLHEVNRESMSLKK